MRIHTIAVLSIAATLLVPSVGMAADRDSKYRHAGCHTHKCDKRMNHKVRHKHLKRKLRIVAPWSAKLDRMAVCESTSRWWLNTGNGFYGGLQFTLSTWRSVGGVGMPHLASKLEQKYRAVKVIHSQGLGAWPVCQYR